MSHTICDNEIDRDTSILKSKVKKALICKKYQNAWPDQIASELLNLLNDRCFTCLTTFFNKMYSKGKICDDWLESVFTILSKERVPTLAISDLLAWCSDHIKSFHYYKTEYSFFGKLKSLMRREFKNWFRNYGRAIAYAHFAPKTCGKNVCLRHCFRTGVRLCTTRFTFCVH